MRLKDRSLCFYEDEWYEPAASRGHRWIETHTGETHDVDADLLAQLTGASAPLDNARNP